MRCTRAMVWAASMPLALMSSCAWSNVDNRPVWNAFEERLVSEEASLFAVTLPLTIPIGLASIVVDTVIAHPVQVVDEAYDDARQAWDPDQFDFQDAYYTELASLPGRVVGTPLVFTGSFMARCLFDLPASAKPMSAAETAAASNRQEEAALIEMRGSFIDWLRRPSDALRLTYVGEWHESFGAPLRAALSGDASQRADLHAGMLRVVGSSFGNYDGEIGLRDPDPVVRYVTIKSWPRNTPDPSTELLSALLGDGIESVRVAAQKRFVQ